MEILLYTLYTVSHEMNVLKIGDVEEDFHYKPFMGIFPIINHIWTYGYGGLATPCVGKNQ